MWHHFFPLLFPKDSESLKILDIRLREVGAKRPLNGTSKVNTYTDRQTDKHMDISTCRKHRPRGPMLWKYFDHPSPQKKNTNNFYYIKNLQSVGASFEANALFKASALWADAFYKSKCPYVCLCVCSLLRYCLNVFLPPLPEVGCPIFLEIRNPWGKVMERSGLTLEHFSLEVV